MIIATENNNTKTLIALAEDIDMKVHEKEDLHLFTYIAFAGNIMFGMPYKWDFSYIYDNKKFIEALRSYKDKMRLRSKFMVKKPIKMLPVSTQIEESKEDLDLIRFLYNEWGIPAYRIHSEDTIVSTYTLTVDKHLNGAICQRESPLKGDRLIEKQAFKLLFDYEE